MNMIKQLPIHLLSLSMLLQLGSCSYIRKLSDIECWNEIPLQEDLNFKYRLNTDDNNKTYVSVELVYQAQSWVSVGIPKEGDFRMIGSQAVVGIPSSTEEFNPGIYDLNGKMLPRVELVAAEYQTLFDHSIEQDETSTTLSFSKYIEEEGHNSIVVDTNEPMTLIYAVGVSNTFGYHPRRGSFPVDFTLECKNDDKEVEVEYGQADNIYDTSKEDVPSRKLWKIHGVLAALAWAIATPFAVLSSVFRSKFSGDGQWFKAHTTFNIVGLFLTLAAAGIAFKTIGKEEKVHLSSPHHIVGLLLVIFTLVQFIGAALRPKAVKSIKRRKWEYFHKILAHVLLFMSIYQIVSGLSIYSMYYGVWNLFPVYLVWIAIVLLLAFEGKRRMKKAKALDLEQQPVQKK